MILTDTDITTCMKRGDIVIKPFDKKRLNPNSYNLRLANRLLVYSETDPGENLVRVLDPYVDNPTERITIPRSGFILHPGRLYLGSTIEHTESHTHVPMIEGRSSLGRLGVFIHVTAGFGDVGFCGHWTLEITCVQVVRIYPGMEVCQMYWHTCSSPPTKTYEGKYQRNTGVQPSLLYTEKKP